MKGWKQPIPNPTTLEAIFNEDWGCCLLYKELVWRGCNEDGFFTDSRTKKTVVIKRGQVVFGRTQWGLYLQRETRTISRWLEKLEKVYNLVTNQPNNNFTIVTIKNYDDVVGMTNQLTNLRPTHDQPMTTSKSVKSKRVKDITTESPPKIYHSSATGKDYTIESLGDAINTRFSEMDLPCHKDVTPFKAGLTYWLEKYTLEEVVNGLKALDLRDSSGKRLWWAKDPNPQLVFRMKGRDQQPVDYIGELLHIYRKHEPKHTA